MSDLSLLSGAERKLDFGGVRSAFDLKQTWGLTSFWGRLLAYFIRRRIAKCYASSIAQGVL